MIVYSVVRPGKEGADRGLVRPPWAAVNRRRRTLSGRCRSRLKWFTASRHVCAITACLPQSLQNTLRPLLSLTPFPLLLCMRFRTRGDSFELIQHHCHYDLRKFNFTNRLIPIWNSLSNHVVSASTINTFKDRLDKFWSNQEVLYDYKVDLNDIGNGSIIM